MTFNDKNTPWLNGHIKRLINQENEIFKKYLRGKRAYFVYENLQTTTWDLIEAIISWKNVFYERLTINVNDPNNSSKAYWSIIE